MEMNNTSRSIILIVITIIITAGLFKVIMSFKEEIKPKDDIEAIKGVRTQTIKLSSNKAIIPFSGSIKAFNKIEVFAEVSGVLQNANFKEGVRFSKGQMLVSIESSEIRNNLKAQKSNLLTQVSALMGDIAIDFPNELKTWEAFLSTIEVDQPLPDLPEIKDKKFKIYISGKQILNTYYSIKSQEKRLGKYTIPAPFNGVIAQTNIKEGTLIRAGQKIGEFVGTDIFDLETEFSLVDKKYVSIGDEVSLSSKDLERTWTGTIYRINPAVDANSQMVTAYVKLIDNSLKEGMFLTGEINGKVYESTALVSRKLITDNKIFAVKDGKLIERDVKVLFTNDSDAIVQGLNNGEEILRDNLKGLYAGMKVTVVQ